MARTKSVETIPNVQLLNRPSRECFEVMSSDKFLSYSSNAFEPFPARSEKAFS